VKKKVLHGFTGCTKEKIEYELQLGSSVVEWYSLFYAHCCQEGRLSVGCLEVLIDHLRSLPRVFYFFNQDVLDDVLLLFEEDSDDEDANQLRS